MKEPVWLLKQVLLACHADALQEHGGLDGIRDEGLLDSALARPFNLHRHERVDLFRLAATYAAGIVQNHPCLDGNKRAGFLAAAVFLERNGLQLTGHPAHAAAFIIGLADGSCSEEVFAAWLRDNTKRSRKRRKN